MNNLVPLFEAIKKVYLSAAADLSVLQEQFSKELTVYDERFEPCSYHELTLLFDRISLDTRSTALCRREASRLQSKLAKASSAPKKARRANLRLVK